MAWSAAKRKSVQGYTPGLANPWPSGSIGILARAAVAWLFSADSWPATVVAAIVAFGYRERPRRRVYK
mgnify:CR=1 FL=1